MSKQDKIIVLKKEIKQLMREFDDAGQIMNDLSKRRNELSRRIGQLENNLSHLVPANLQISDHAVLRYAERHYGLQFEEIRKEIQERLSSIGNIGNMKACGFVVKNNVVATYLPEEVVHK